MMTSHASQELVRLIIVDEVSIALKEINNITITAWFVVAFLSLWTESRGFYVVERDR